MPVAQSSDPRWKILVIAGLRFPIRQPFVGGLESHTWSLVQGLRQRGHLVQVAGAAGSDPNIIGHTYGRMPTPTGGERADTAETPEMAVAEAAAFDALLTDLREGMLGTFDLVHNNSLYPAPVLAAADLGVPLVSTLHTPPLPWADRVLGGRSVHCGRFVAVSNGTARSWHPWIRPDVVGNGVDVGLWPAGPGGREAMWSGRLVPEKGAHLAIAIARAAGIGLRLAGPVIDKNYWDERIAPELDDTVTYVGHLAQPQLAELVGSSAVALVTPVWDEPFGLVAIEAGATGTPVVAFRRGGLIEILSPSTGRLLPSPEVPDGLTSSELAAAADAVRAAAGLDRTVIRAETRRRFDLSTMIAGYEAVYADELARTDWS